METPLAARKFTRSQGLPSRKIDNSDMSNAKSLQKSAIFHQQDRSALIDITNDSPIVGLAMGSLGTPSSFASKKKMCTPTPGSGEALLRGQVKTLLQKVEEEAEISRITLENRPIFKLGVNSPFNLIAPTPANTPQVFNLSGQSDDNGLPSGTPVIEKLLIPQMVTGKKVEEMESENHLMVTRLLDFSEDSSSKKVPTTDDDDSSIWSIQASARSSTRDDEECAGVEEEDDYYEEEEDGGLVNELCNEMNRISVGEWPKFTGKHTRFVCSS